MVQIQISEGVVLVRTRRMSRGGTMTAIV